MTGGDTYSDLWDTQTGHAHHALNFLPPCLAT